MFTRKPSSTGGGGGGGDDNASVISDVSTFSEATWMSRFGMSRNNEVSVDDVMKLFYQDPDILEERCKKAPSSDPEDNKQRAHSSFHFGTSSSDSDNYVHTGIRACKTADEVIATLNEGYFMEDFDPIQLQLEEVSKWSEEEMMSKFMSTIEDADTDKDMVLTKLSAMIELNYNELMACMRDVHAIDLDLAKASIQVTNSRRKLNSGMDLIAKGTLNITRLHQLRDRLYQVQTVVSVLQGLKNQYDKLQECLKIGDVGRTAEFCFQVLTALQDDIYDSIKAVNCFGIGVQDLLPVLRHKTDKSLYLLVSRRFASDEYANILKAYILLDSMRDNMGVNIVAKSRETDADDLILHDNKGCISGLAARIQRYQISDINTCLRSAVLELMYAQEQSDLADGNVPRSQMLHLPDLSLQDLYKQLPNELLVACLIRSCEMLTSVIHTHYLITQWHRTPFDERNRSEQFLHRCPNYFDNDFSDHESSDDDENDEHKDNVDIGLNGTKLKKSEVREDFNSYGRLLNEPYEGIVACRSVLWEELEYALLHQCSVIVPTHTIPIEEFASLLWVLNRMVGLCKEFCNQESRIIPRCISEKCYQYTMSCLKESSSSLKNMLDTEPWRNVPIQLHDLGGVVGIIRMSLMRHGKETSGGYKTKVRVKGMIDEIRTKIQKKEKVLQQTRSNLAAMYTKTGSEETNANELDLTQDQEITSQENILMSFVTKGNPFHFLTDSDANQTLKTNIDFNNLEAPILTEVMTLLHDDESVTINKRNQDKASMIVTQTSINGLSRFSGKYIQMMVLMPSCSQIIFRGLTQLFDLYLYSVYHGFVLTEEKQRLFNKTQRQSAPPPIQTKEYEALQLYLQRLLHENNSVSNPSATPTKSDKSSDNSPFAGYISELNQEMVRLMKSLQIPQPLQYCDERSHFSLYEKIVAAESCWFASKILLEIKSKILKFIPESDKNLVINYITEVQLVSSQLRSLIYKGMCPPLIKQPVILSELDAAGWDQKKMLSEPHEWVESLVMNCSVIWDFMERSNDFSEASILVREQVWLEVCQAAFDTVLEGFSRVKKCATEGRASMTMDLSALHTGLDGIHVCKPPRGKQYVDNFVKASYLSEDELVHWVEQNWQNYAYRHLHSLLTNSSVMKKKRLKEAIAILDSYYDQASREENSLSDMLLNLSPPLALRQKQT